MKKIFTFCFLAVIILVACSKKKDPVGNTMPTLSAAKDLTSFTLFKTSNNALKSDVTATISGTTVTIPLTADITNDTFIANFSVSAKAKLFIGAAEMVSGQTPNNYAQPVILTVKAEDGSTANYTVSISRTGIAPNSNINSTTSYYQYTQTFLYVNLATLIPTTISGSPYWGDAYNARAYADFNKDGNIDLMCVTANNTANAGIDVEYYKNFGSGFQKDQTVFNGSVSQYVHGRKAIVGDFDKNGWLDVIIAGHGWDQPPFPGETMKLILNTNGKFTTSQLPLASGFYHSVCAGDIDNDGDLDIFCTNNFGTGSFLLNNGHGNFIYDITLYPTSLAHKNYFTSELYDLNNDGYLDLITTGHEQDGANSIILWGNYTGKYSDTRMTILPKVTNFGIAIGISFIDYNKDGQMDIVVNRTGDGTGPYAFYQGYYIQVLKNTSGVFTDVTATVMSQNANINAPKWVNWYRIQDVNSDGWPDITSDDKYYGLVWINNNGFFTKQSNSTGY